MTLIVLIVISLAILFIVVGAWLSLPAGVPLAPSQRFIDSLPTWLQGPRCIAPKVKEEAVSLFNDVDQALEHRVMSVTNTEQPSESEPAESVHDEP